MGFVPYPRVLAVVVGVIIAAVGGWLSWGVAPPTDGGPSTIGLILRPPASGAGDWRVLSESEAKSAGDIDVSISFEVRKLRRRKLPTITQLTAVQLMATDHDQVKAAQEFAQARDHLGLMADEVERRTGKAVYAKAVRLAGETIDVDSERMWWGFGLFIGGLGLAISAMHWNK